MADKPKPAFTLNDQEKMGAFASLIPVILDTLQSYHPEVEITADDILDFFCLGIGALNENDTHITTLRHRRLALETTATHITRWMKALRDQREAAGEDAPSFLAYLLEEDRRERQNKAN